MKVTIVNNIWSCTDSPKEVKEFLSYEQERWITQYGRKMRKTIKRSFCSAKGYFFTGFVPSLIDEFNCEIEDKRVSKNYNINIPKELGGKTPRDHQIKMVESSLSNKSGVSKSPTGSGKTMAEAMIFKSCDDWSCLLIVHTKSLLSQIKNELEIFIGEDIGQIGDGIIEWRRITIGMIQTLNNISRDELRKRNIDCFIVDEVHHACSKTYQNVLSAINAEYRFGFSATPKDFEDKDSEYMAVLGLIGPIISETTYEDVKEYLAVPEVRIVKYNGRQLFSKMSWHYTYNYMIEENEGRNQAIANQVYSQIGSILILLKTIKHATILKDYIPEALTVDGSDDVENREKIKRYLGNKKISRKIVIATSVFGEGVDLPSLDCVINAGGGKSKIQTIQRAGRALRQSAGKINGIIIDFEDTGNIYTQDHFDQRYDTYKKCGWIL